MAAKKRLGELLVEANLITEEECAQALKMQVGGTRRLGHILVQMGAITSDQLLEILSDQFELPILDLDQEFSSEAKSIMPRYLCRKYEVIPLGIIKEKILKLGMADPSDSEAIIDIENFTGTAIQPCLARQSDINLAIKKYIPFSLRDFFNPQSYTSWAKGASALALILIIAVAGFTFRFYNQTKYGSITKTADATIYKNHDLMVGIENSGTTTLLGRGAYANGYYSISFHSPEALENFLEHKKEDLSTNQYEWAKWAVSNTQ